MTKKKILQNRVPITLNDKEEKLLAAFMDQELENKKASAVKKLFLRGLMAWKKENPLIKIAVQEKIDL